MAYDKTNTPLYFLCDFLNLNLVRTSKNEAILRDYALLLWEIFHKYIRNQASAFRNGRHVSNGQLGNIFNSFLSKHALLLAEREEKLLKITELLDNLCTAATPGITDPEFKNRWCPEMQQWVDKMNSFSADFKQYPGATVEEDADRLHKNLLFFLRDVWDWVNKTGWMGPEWAIGSNREDGIAAQYRIALFATKANELVGVHGQLGAEKKMGSKGSFDFFTDLMQVAELALALKLPTIPDMLRLADDAINAFRQQNAASCYRIVPGENPFLRENGLPNNMNALHAKLFIPVQAAWAGKNKAGTAIEKAKADCDYQHARQRFRENALVLSLVPGTEYSRKQATIELAALTGMNEKHMHERVNDVSDQVFLLFTSGVLK